MVNASNTLTSFTGLGALENVSGDLTITNNTGLTSFGGLGSGAMYGTVPAIVPVLVKPLAPEVSYDFARPKSESLTATAPCWSHPTSMLASLMSRWTMPLSCAWARPSSACVTISTASLESSPPGDFASSSPASVPSTYSITMQKMPGALS